MSIQNSVRRLMFAGLAAVGVLTAMGPAAYGAGAGYSTFFIPGDEDLIAYALRDLEDGTTPSIPPAGTTMHSLIAVTAWADNTIVIVDHWEDGYEYDINNPASAYDELFTLAAAGDAKLFEDSNIALGRTVNGVSTFCDASADEVDDSVCVLDGRDILYIVGTSATVTRASWIEGVNTFQSLAWEVYPVRPQLIKYILPFGEELNAQGLLDFERVYGLIQATGDNTVLQIDFDGDGTYDDFDFDYDGTTDGIALTLNRGDVYLLDRRSDAQGSTLNTGTTILGSDTLQVQYLIGDEGSDFELRGLSAFPRGFWDDEYYAPVDQADNGARVTDIYLYNPNATNLTIDWETATGSGSFVIGTTNRAVSFIAQPGASVPQNGAVYLKGSDVFWGISSIDAGLRISDWGYSLAPNNLLDNEYFLGWAPAYAFSVLPFDPGNGGDDRSGLFITAAQDNTIIFVDEDVNGVPDQTISLDRLQTAYVTSSNVGALNDDDLSQARIYATGPYAMAYGQNPDNSAISDGPALDLGYTVLPTSDRWFDLVLDVDKSANPTLLAAETIGAITTFTVRAYSQSFSVDELVIVDTLPAGMEYVAGFTIVTLPDNTTVTGPTADDGNTTGATTMTWSEVDVFGAFANLAENQAISISFRARTTVDTFLEGALATNNVVASGSRTVQGIEQVFTATDFAFVTFSDSSLAITKTSDVDPLAFPGDTITYTVNILNDGVAPLTNISVYDALPDGVTYGSGTVVFPPMGSAATNPAPGLISASDGYSLAVGESLVLTITAIVDDPLATSISELTNQACATSDEIRLPLCADVTDPVSNPSVETGQVGDLVWLDVDGDGIKDPGEPGLANVEVTLKDEFGTPVAVALTDSNGGYRFTGVLPGNDYFVDITAGLPAGLIQTAPSGRSDDRTDSFGLASGQVYLDADLGYRPPAGTGTIGDYVWQDINMDTIQDPGELGLGGVTVLLYRDVNNNGTLEAGGAPTSIDYSALPQAIPDNDPVGISVTATVANGPVAITGVSVNVDATHTWVGDLIFTLTSADGTMITLLDRPGAPATGNGCQDNDVVATFIDGAADPEGICTGANAAWPVTLAAPVTALAALNGEDANGVWTLTISDNAGGDTGTLNNWELVIDSVPIGDGAPIASVVTAPDGSYNFFGVDATDGAGTDDYFVSVDTAQAALTGYTASTFPQTSVADLVANEARLSNDFGFFPIASPRYTYRDRVWFDPNEDEQDDSDTGISGVTVNLLNSARQVIGTAITDASGYFDFAGLEGSTFYYVEISDNAGSLTDYFGTTAEAVAGELQIANLTGNLDFTVEPTEPNFGYNAYGAIGDTVFNDLNGDGDQDAGEPGIGGVTVQLYNDINGNGRVDGADAVIGTLLTDSNGKYVFSGVSDGDYTVSVGTSPSGTTFTGTDSDDPTTPGSQLAATVSGGGSFLDADFGFVATVPRSISGTLWNDANKNGSLDDAGRFANVTIELRDSDGLIAITTTDASGNYSFAGLPAAADYQVIITDSNGVLNGYQATFEVSEGALNGPYNGRETVDVTAANATSINFAYYRPPTTPLAVSLSSFRAERSSGGTHFEWTTDNEVGNIGFYLLGEVKGEWVDVSADLIPSPVIDSSVRQNYSYDSDRIDAETFMLVDVDVSGKARYHGPFGLGASRVSEPPLQQQVDWVSIRAEHADKVAARREAVFSRGAALSAARLLIEGEGLYSLSYESLVDQGFDFAGTPVASMGLFDRNGAVPMAVVPGGAIFGPGMAIEFYGEASKSLYNKRNYYTLRTDQAGVIAQADGATPSGSPATTYQETTRIENDLDYTFGSPNGDPWYDTWVRAISGPATLNRSVVIEDLMPGAGSAALSLELWGVTYWPAAPDHRVKATLNGLELVDETFDGHTSWSHEVAIDPTLLDTGADAVLQLHLPRDLPGVVYDIVAVDDYSITYPRRLTTRSATPNRLYFSHPGAGSYRVDGFGSDGIVVYRRDGSGSLQRLTESSVAWNGANYEITFNGGGPADYFVQARSTLLEPNVVPVPASVDLGAGPAKYLVIAHPDFIAGVQPLVDYRTGQGYSADVVDVEAIYEQYSNGMVDPEAIRAYIAEAVANRATGYVLLVGGDSYDYHDRLGFGSLSFIPSIYAATEELITHAPVDPLFGDIDRDGTVDVPVGRLPVRTDSELAAIINKVQEFEAKNYEQTLLAATDKYDLNQGLSFKALSDQLLQPLAGTWTITHADVETLGLEGAKQQVKDALNEGQAFAQYFGHSSQNLWSFDRLLQVSDVDGLLNQGRPALVAQWGCWNNYFVDPQTSALGVELLTAQDRGAAAVLGASTWTSTAGDMALGNHFMPLIAEPGRTVGDVLVASKRSLALAQPGQHLGVQWGWTLLGDPLMVLQSLEAGSCLGNPATGDGDGDGICDDLDVCVGSDRIGDIDGDSVCYDLDICVGFPDGADADADGVPDGCDLCLGDDAEGDPDGDGICGVSPDLFSDGFESGITSR